MVYGITGLSGVGKTTIVNQLEKEFGFKRLSSTRLLMELLGIVTKDEPTKDEHYKILESISQNEKEKVLQSKAFISFIESKRKEETIYIYEIHFVVPARTELSIQFQLYPIYDWYFKHLEAIINVTSSTDTIYKRKLLDSTRDRGKMNTDAKSTEIQNIMHSRQWEELEENKPDKFKTFTTINKEGQVEVAVLKIANFIKEVNESK